MTKKHSARGYTAPVRFGEPPAICTARRARLVWWQVVNCAEESGRCGWLWLVNCELGLGLDGVVYVVLWR
jgi:hypothetical protein